MQVMTDASAFFLDTSLVECRAVDIGGGRGVFVTADVLAGTVLFTEEPLISVGEQDVRASETWHMAIARCVLQSHRMGELMLQLQRLHPQQLGDLPPSVVEQLRLKYSGVAKRLASLAVAPVTPDDALILLLKVQMNAFDVGLCLNMAMLNHACFPNCKVFGPGERMGLTTGSEKKDSPSLSELVAIRPLRAGEQVTISFFGSVEQSASRRRLLFAKQHLVTLSPDSTTSASELELFSDGVLDSLSSNNDLAELEERLDCLATKGRMECADGSHSAGSAARLLKDITALESSTLSLLHPRHVVLGKIHRLMARAALVQLDAASDAKIAEQLVRTSTELLSTQVLSVPDTHWDLIETLEGLAFGIETLLSCNPSRLFAAFPCEYGDFRTAALAEAALRKKAAGIRELYILQANERTPAVTGPCDSKPSKIARHDNAESAPQNAVDPDWSIFG